MNHGLSQQGCGGGAVTGYIVGLGGYFFNKLGTHVFKWILQFDFTGNGNTVINDVRSAEFLVKNYIAALRSQGNLYCISQLVNTLQESCPGFFIIKYFFSHLYHSYKFIEN